MSTHDKRLRTTNEPNIRVSSKAKSTDDLIVSPILERERGPGPLRDEETAMAFCGEKWVTRDRT